MNKAFYILLLLILIQLGACSSYTNSSIKIKAREGVLNLSNWNADESVELQLDGQWDFYFNELITPHEYFNGRYPKHKKVSMQVPSFWSKSKNTFENNKYYPPTGFATYILKVKNFKQLSEKIAIFHNHSYCAYSLYLITDGEKNLKNIKPIIRNGVVGRSKEEEIPQQYPEFETTPKLSSTFHIIVHVSNFHHKRGGLSRSIKIGKLHNLGLKVFAKKAVYIFFLGSFLIMGLYHFTFYLSQRRSTSSLYLSIFCVILAIRLITADRLFGAFISQPSVWYYEFYAKIIYSNVYLTLPIFYTFLRSVYKEEFPAIYQKINWLVFTIFTIITIFRPAISYGPLMKYYHFLMVSIILLSFFFVFKSWKLKRVGAGIALLALTTLIIGLSNDILASSRIITSIYISPIASVTFVFLLSYVLAQKVSRAFLTAEHLTNNLQEEINKHTIELQRKNSELKRLDKQKSSFFQNISHELRSPLTLILHPIQEACRKYKDDNSLVVAEKNSQKLARLLNQFLDFQKVSNIYDKISLTTINIVPFLRTYSEFFSKSCEQKNIKFDCLLPDAEIPILSQIDALETIVFNYLSNALKFTPNGGSIKLSVESNDDEVTVTVTDSGIGISKADQEKLFKLFSIVEENSMRDYGGTGLGLALVKAHAQTMNATVSVKSEKGFGSSFYITFPKAKPQKKVLDLLIIDDEPEAIQFSTTAIVEELPEVSFMTGNCTDQAKELLKHHDFKCLIIDAVMPGQNGIEFIAQPNGIHPDTKKILVTGEANLELMRDAINKSSIDHMLYKPYSPEELSYLVKKILSSSPMKQADETDLKNFKPKNWMSSELPDIEDTSERSIEANSSKLVLVIDDIYDMRELIARLLENQGYDVITAKDGASGLKKAEENEPSLIITDWMMPGTSGIKFITKVQANPLLKSVPIIMLSAKSDIESKVESQRAGAAAHIGKPFNDLELISTVNNLLNLKQKENDVNNQNKRISDEILVKLLPKNLVDDLVDGKTDLKFDPKLASITVLISDLSEFATQTNSIGILKSSEILKTYFDAMSSIIYSCNGIIDKFIGDKIVTLFGTNASHTAEQQALSAQTCAIKMHRELSKLNKIWREQNLPEQNLRIGLHYGPACLGYIGSEERTEFTAIGPTIATASKIEKVTSAGETFVSESIRDLLPENACEAAGDFDIYSNDEKHKLYKLTAINQ